MDITTLASLALGWARRAAVALGGAGLVAAGAACNSLFDVRNPNDVLADSLNNPAAGGKRSAARNGPWTFLDVGQLRSYKLTGRAPPKTSRQPAGGSRGAPWLSGIATIT